MATKKPVNTLETKINESSSRSLYKKLGLEEGQIDWVFIISLRDDYIYERCNDGEGCGYDLSKEIDYEICDYLIKKKLSIPKK